ncbi:Deoxyuridine 5'-triphosphate nucleotidohydrolase [Candidatus Cyrtobacter comes]|uniref:Deoxyuridine 5'-triphosphate nucleotidohydrolase n=1 Tax=Candidatus Cyrtobacter comes TaxID=675776 RepID=A0ABU5L9C9_9RICK|nr:dUTP diphosphatase [Candidatus Cyrtobacter comes]MDZ5762726.1 Deoxyuridine 5'-triphosphate nucleotidohydrolase [Candidatus Cyrtobacter comes]
MFLDVKRLSNLRDLPLPSYATLYSAGMDLMAAIDQGVVIKSMERKLIPTGIAISIPEGYEVQIRPRSGLAIKHGITLVNAPGTVDADYRGEIFVPLINLGGDDFTVERGMRIAQLILNKFETVNWNMVEELNETVRGVGGFGSTGIK